MNVRFPVGGVTMAQNGLNIAIAPIMLAAVIGMLAWLLYYRSRSIRDADQLISWFSALRQGDFSVSRVPS
ncbi:MAG TPA: hypothetical protein VKQ27_16910, partial [Acetobacteraceae bacterium]|nr:hypothetical protein [Acetobacteraceae bacterium]